MRKFLITWLALLAWQAVPAVDAELVANRAADSTADAAANFANAEAVYQKALAQGGQATDDAVARFEKLAAADSPLAPLFLAYLGSAQTLQGRDAWMPWTKMRATERGLDTLEKALRRLEARHDREVLRGVAVAVEARLVAASTFIAVPSMFNRYDLGKETLRAALASPAYPSAPAAVKARLHRLAAVAAARDGKPADEAAHLRQALDVAPNDPDAGAARRRLQALKS